MDTGDDDGAILRPSAPLLSNGTLTTGEAQMYEGVVAGDIRGEREDQTSDSGQLASGDVVGIVPCMLVIYRW